MKIHLYFSCWNNADILGFFFRHYDPFVSRYFVYDDGSTDGSLAILSAHPNLEIRKMPRAAADEPHTLAAMELLERMWRVDSADADWVLICDVDEHLHHPDLVGYLSRCRESGITIVPALGYQMLADSLPTEGLLCEQVTRGAPFTQMSKLNLFCPRHIESLNYTAGRHEAAPIGNVVAPDHDELLLLHYKYLGFERAMQRHAACAARLRPSDIEQGWGHRWRFDRDQLRKDWAEFDRRAVDISSLSEPGNSPPEPRWWDSYRRSRKELQTGAAA